MERHIVRCTRADRFKVNRPTKTLERYSNEQGFWSEGEEDVAAGLAWGEEKALLLRWVRKQMRYRLTARQRLAIQLYYFEDLTYVEMARRMECAPSSACRSVHRAIRRLREAARVDPPAHLRRPSPTVKRRNRRRRRA